MATLNDLVEDGVLVRHVPELEPWELPTRAVYFAPDFNDIDLATLKLAPRIKGRNSAPFEQVEQILFVFVVGRAMKYGQDHKLLRPENKFVWSLRTVDVRLFGWFVKKGNFVIVRAEFKRNLLAHKNYAPLIEETLKFREGLDLGSPKFVKTVKYNEIL